MNKHINFGLLENALDFVLSAAEHGRKNTPRDLKYSLLHIAAGVELLLKARLQKEHWSLLFSDVNKASKSALANGNFISVDPQTAHNRLAQIANVQLSQESIDHLKQLRQMRNKIQHFAIKIEVERIRSLVGQVQNIVLDFISNNLKKEAEEFEHKIEEIRDELKHFKEFNRARMQIIKPSLEGAKRIIECPDCWQEALVLDDDPHCFFCGSNFDWSTLADLRSETEEVMICPTCGQHACTLVLFKDNSVWYCIACDERGNYLMCPRCGIGLINEDDGICSDCWDNVNSDDV